MARPKSEEWHAREPGGHRASPVGAPGVLRARGLLGRRLRHPRRGAGPRDTARSRRHRAMDPGELHSRQQAARGLRHWRDELGMVGLAGALPPEVGIPFVNRLEAETNRIRGAARRQGSTEPRAAHAADALVALVAGTGRPSATRADLVVVWDRSAAATGDDEGQAHIVGGGPVPTSVARRLAERAFVKTVIHNGVRIETV